MKTDSQLRVLFLEDTEEDAEMSAAVLRDEGFVFTSLRVATRESFMNAMHDFRPDIVLSDMSLPRFDGASALAIAQREFPTVPVIMVTGTLGDAAAVALLKAGASDYVLKDQLGRLGAAVRGALAEQRAASERSAALNALGFSEEKFRAVFEGSSDAILLINGSVIIDCNPRSLEMFGVETKDQFLKLSPGDLSPDQQPDGRLSSDAAQNHMHTAFLHGSCRFDWSHRRRSGEEFPSEVFYAALRLAGDRILCATIRDISERVRSTDIRIAAQRRFRALIEDAPDFTAVVDTLGTVQYVSPAVKRVAGYDPSDIIGTPFMDFVHPDDAGMASESFGKVLAGGDGSIQQSCFRYRAAGGKWIEIEAAARNLLHSPEINGIVVNTLDVTQRRAAERDLAEERRRYKTLFDILPIGLVLLDPLTVRPIEFNEIAHLQLGYTREEFSALKISNYEALETVEQTEARVRDILAKGHDAFETEHRTKDGGLRNVHVTVQVVELHGLPLLYAAYRDITSQKRAEEEISRLAAVVEQAGDSIVITDLDGSIKYVNPFFEQITGYSAAEVVGSNPRLLKSGLVTESVYRDLWTTIVNGGVWKGEFINRRKGGDVFPEDVTVFPVRDKGKTIGFAAVKRDATARKAAELRLERLRQLYATLISANESIVRAANQQELFDNICRGAVTAGGFTFAWVGLLDSAGRELRVSSRFGTNSLPDSVGVPFRDHGEEGPVERAVRDSCVHFVNDLLSGTGGAALLPVAQEGYGSAAAVPMRLGGNVIGALTLYSREAMFFDADQVGLLEQLAADMSFALGAFEAEASRQRVDRELLEQAVYFRQLFENSPSAIALTDEHDHVIDLNASFRELFQYGIGEVKGKSLADFIVPDGGISEASEIATRTMNGESFHKVCRRKRKDNTVVDVTLTAFPIQIASRVVGAYRIFEDISDEQRLEQQLRHAQKMESVGTLASGIAHDFNNILGIILGHISVMEGAATAAEIESSLDVIRRMVDRGSTLVRQILTFARRSDTAYEPVNLNDLLTDLSGVLRETLPKTIDIVLELDAAVPVITLDRGQVDQALLNLCVNARDAMVPDNAPEDALPRGRLLLQSNVVNPAVVQSRFPGAPLTEYASVSVADNGCGMDESVKNRIFNPFFTTKGPGKGTGLGLAIVYGVVKKHAGFIDVESTPDKGSRFTIYIPLSTKVYAATSPPSPHLPADSLAGDGQTILLVEDEIDWQNIVTNALRRHSYTVITAADGLEAMERFADHASDIAMVVTDLDLPKLGGDELCTRIIELHPSIPIIVMTGYMSPQTEAAFTAKGIRAVLRKPCSVNALLASIKGVING